jgi:hypothetical protein
MKTSSRKLTERVAWIIALVILVHQASAQYVPIQFFRQYDKQGINVFETPNIDTLKYEGFKLRLGANFTQGYQALSHSNTSGVPLYALSNGFPLAMANLNLDVQLADGVRVQIISYLSSHHHNETWVKGGYLQVNKVGFLNSDLMNKIWKNLTLKVGHMEINYGDAHFRRSDGGNTFWNPFIENNIMDAFTTEIGGELYFQKKGFIAMYGMTNGEIQGAVTGAGQKSPSIYGKVGYDKKLGDRKRIRLTGSFLTKSSSISGTLFQGDRTGSNYNFVLEPANATLTGNPFSGRLHPNLTDNVTTFVVNPFVKYNGLELFGTLEFAQGNTAVENGKVQYTASAGDPTVFSKLGNRHFNQIAVDLLYRFGKGEKFFIGGRYNTVSGTQVFNQSTTNTVSGGINQGTRADVTIDRATLNAGWFVSKNILIKGEYVTQGYLGFPTTDIQGGGKFNGVVVQGSIAF